MTKERPLDDSWTADHIGAVEDLANVGRARIGVKLKPVDPDELVYELAGNRRVARVSVRPGYRVGQHLGLLVRLWGMGRSGLREGQPSYATTPESAKLWALRWVEVGR